MSAISFYTQALSGTILPETISPSSSDAAPRSPSPEQNFPSSSEDAVEVSLSDEAREYSAAVAGQATDQTKSEETRVEAALSEGKEKEADEKPAKAQSGDGEGEAENQGNEQAEQQELRQLKERDREVRAHEQAHISAGGQYVTSGAKFSYQTGPDGKRYAVGGEVSINVSSEGSPEQTVRKMQQVRRAALAPAQPSGADRQVAAYASRAESQARAEQVEERAAELEDSKPTRPSEPKETSNEDTTSKQVADTQGGESRQAPEVPDISGAENVEPQVRESGAKDQSPEIPSAAVSGATASLETPSERHSFQALPGGLLNVVA